MHFYVIKYFRQFLFIHLFCSKQTKIEITTSERALLGLFMAKIHRIDPDVLVVCNGFLAPFGCVSTLLLTSDAATGNVITILSTSAQVHETLLAMAEVRIF